MAAGMKDFSHKFSSEIWVLTILILPINFPHDLTLLFIPSISILLFARLTKVNKTLIKKEYSNLKMEYLV